MQQGIADQGAGPFPSAAVCQLLFNMPERGSAGCMSLPNCSGISMVQPTSIQHASAWQCRVQVPPQLQRCGDGATYFPLICFSVAVQGATPSPLAVVG
jgi:hypothetical protein